MKRLLLTLLVLLAITCSAKIQYSSTNAPNHDSQAQRNTGPRFGLTYITNGTLTDDIEEEFGVTSNLISQFGYQFEKQIMGDENIAGILEGILFIGGVDQGLFLPSISGMFGVRNKDLWELAVGPNLSINGAAMVIGFGKSFNFGNINVPVNIAWVPSITKRNDYINFDGVEISETENSGHRFTITLGFNMAK